MAAIVSVASGDVNVAANWSPTQVPTSADDVTVNGHTITVPDGVTFEPLSLVLQGPDVSNRGTLIVVGTYVASGGCTLEQRNKLAVAAGGEIDLAGGDIAATSTENASYPYNVLEFVGSAANWCRVHDSVGGGSITGPAGVVMRCKLTAQYCTFDQLSDNGLLVGSSYYGNSPIFIDHVVFHEMGFWQLGDYTHGDDDFTVTNIDVVGSQSAVVEDGEILVGRVRTDRTAPHSGLGTATANKWCINAATVGPKARLRLEVADYYDVDNLISDNCNIVRIGSAQTLNTPLLVLRTPSGGNITAGADCQLVDPYIYASSDNPHTYTGGDVTGGVLEAVYAEGQTDAGDHFILPTSDDFALTDMLIIDKLGGATLNALGDDKAGTYSARHCTIVVDIPNSLGVAYGHLVRNETGGRVTGNLSLYDNICYIRANNSGDSEVRAINFETALDDQIAAMDNNAYIGYSSTPSTIYYGVTSATKSIGDTDYGESDLIDVLPAFVDDSRDLASWQSTQNGGGTAEDAIAEALLINGYDAATKTQISANESGFDVTEVISWVKAGYAPTAVGYDSTASDGGTIGAVDYLALVDVISPTISSSSVSADGGTVTTVFDENVDVGEGGDGGFTATATYGNITLTPTTTLPASTVAFTPSRTIENGETLGGVYTQPGDGFEDESGNDLESTTFSITNNSKVHKVFSDASKTTPYTTAGVIARVLDQDLTDAVAPQTVDPDVSGYVQLIESLASGSYTLVATSSDGSLNAIGEHIVP